MLKCIKQIFIARAIRRHTRTEQNSIEAWSLHFGRDAAALWLEVMSVRDAAKLSNA